jgi:predicted small lipoprotein YifL
VRKTRQKKGKAGFESVEIVKLWPSGAFPLQFHHRSALARSGQSLYGAAALGKFTVNRSSSSSSPKRAAIVLAVAALALAGCGRKGPLDLPPTGSAQPGSQSSAAPATDTETEQAAKPSVFNPSYGSDAAPVAGRGPKRPFILDPLLNSN